MDYQEAINTIKRECCGCPQFPPVDRKQMCHDGCMYGKDECAFSIAISAMKEIQQYKNFGTPEGFESALKAYDDCYFELQEWKKLGKFEEIMEAVEKQKAKKPKDITDIRDSSRVGICPCCGDILGDDLLWCDNCGQKLDWSVE